MSLRDDIAAMFAELDGRDRYAEALERTRERVEHGYRAYTAFGCRCDTCRAANAEYMRAYAKRRRQQDPSFRAKRTAYEVDRTRRKRAAERAASGERAA